MFSKRTNWDLHPNPLAKMIDERMAQGLPIIDLTESNPTKCGLDHVTDEILSAFVERTNLIYTPNPKGSLAVRQTISEYYYKKGIPVDPEQIFLTSSTSESYNYIFRLLIDPGDDILVPQPSYPLLDYIAQINDVRVKYYKLLYDDEWHIDFYSLRNAISDNTKAIVVIHPNNPTGSYVKKAEYEALLELISKYNAALISDEVFSEFPICHDVRRLASFADTDSVLTFTLNGISKMLRLPQMKLGWIVVKGGGIKYIEAIKRLDIIADTFLSVGTPVQNAFIKWMELREQINYSIINRIKENYNILNAAITDFESLLIYKIEGGWSAIIKLPQSLNSEAISESLVRKYGVIIQPGYFYDFEGNSQIVVSLIVKTDIFKRGIEMLKLEIKSHPKM